jgi:hypothetical protein
MEKDVRRIRTQDGRGARIVGFGLVVLGGALLGVVSGVAAAAPEPTTVTLVLKDHRFTPSSFTVPAGRKVRIVLINQDMAAEEFDSRDLRTEQLVTPKGQVDFSIGPLQPGDYSFMGEFHAATAQGKVTAINEGR